MRKLTATISALLLSLGFATPAESSSSSWDVYQKTLATYSGSNTGLSSLQKSQIRATLDKTPQAEKFICTGIRYFDQPMSVNIMVRKRAKEACAYAKELNPSLSTWYQNKPTKARSYAGKVLLTVKSPKAEITLDNLEIGRVHESAWNSVRDAYSENQALSPEIAYYVSPGVTEQMLEAERQVLEKTARLWSEDFFPKNARIIYAVRGDESEKAWLQDTIDQLGGLRYMLPTSIDNWYDNVCGALASSGGGYYTIVQCLGRDVTPSNLHIVAHEYTHWMQYSVGDLPGKGPNWLTEGGATFYGISIAFMGAENPDTARLNFLKGFTYNHDLNNGKPFGTFRDFLLSSTEDEFVDLMRELEALNFGYGASRQYLLGNLASEALIATFGHSKMLEFYKSFEYSEDWKASFEEIYGLSVLEFYSSLHPYVIKTLEK